MQSKAKDVCEAYLAAFYEDQQGPSAIIDALDTKEKVVQPVLSGNTKDQRLQLINASKYRNDIEVFRFDPGSAFGKGGSRIVDVKLISDEGSLLSWVVGGELVSVVVVAEALQDIFAPIVGFIVKDRLGQALFSDNTFLSYAKQPVRVKTGERFEARFAFQMPILPSGDYMIAVAVADGTQAEHVQHQWVHDALVLTSHSSSACTGLVGIPMLDIQLRKIRAAGEAAV
ncbi:MAG: Wzt carbohydrate-binding domain-containing protein [Nitrososphaera sp.]|nr:Wzt carbohydrate-binding domain-containing protein [Nitrososphaera sp.]